MWWHILGVEPTDDEITVKKAYAKVIRGVNQDKEIEMFTKVHHAYREAMKSFRGKQVNKAPKLSIEGSAVWYLDELDKIYNNTKKRLNPIAWKNIFACMSFSEEKHFVDKYVHYFNNHYFLTDEIWALIEENYPLSNHRDFLWIELTSGFLSVTKEELVGMSVEEKVHYVEQKISLFYDILNHEYHKAYESLLILKSTYPSNEFNRLYLMLSTVMNREDDVTEAYNILKDQHIKSDFVNYYLAGYYNAKKDYKKSVDYLNRLKETTYLGIEKLKNENEAIMNEGHLEASIYPWDELESIPDKARKLFSKGNYTKGNSVLRTQLARMTKGGI